MQIARAHRQTVLLTFCSVPFDDSERDDRLDNLTVNNDFGLCFECWNHCTSCSCARNPVNLQGRSVTISDQGGKRNEASPPQRQEMESSGAGATAMQAPPLPENSYTQTSDLNGMTMSAPEAPMLPDDALANDSHFLFEASDLGLPADHIQASNVRESVKEEQDVSGDDLTAQMAANILANGTANNGQVQGLDNFTRTETAEHILENYARVNELKASIYPDDAFPNGHPHQEMLLKRLNDPQNAKAYAKLVFPDGDFFITTHDVTLGRNMGVFKNLQKANKAQQRAREDLDSYRQEQSQPSQPGDEDQQGRPSNSSQSLEGRPAPPSNVSERGGMVHIPSHSDVEVEMQHSSARKRRSLGFSKSSSTTSIAPASLHPTLMPDFSNVNLFNADGEPETRTSAFIPVHTPNPEHIIKISKEHLKFRYNFQEEQWELQVVGNRAFVNDELFEKYSIVPLEHNDEIMIATVHIVFKLPDNYRHSPGLSRGTFSRDSDEEEDEFSDEEDDVAISTSPVRRLSNAMEANDSEDEEGAEEIREQERRPKVKIKVNQNLKHKKANSKTEKGKKKQDKSKMKRSKKESPLEESPEAAKKPEKGKKPKAAAGADANASSPPPPPQIEPGAGLEGIPLEELPQKRKGPGRPPKNGFVSRRDGDLVKRKLKEYEKRGEQPPTYDVLVDWVRREQAAKGLQTKLVQSGQIAPGMPVMPSIETELPAGWPNTGSSADGNGPTSGTAAEPARRASPKPKRTVKSPSPMKPESECTEEELKKPNGTYVIILNEVLEDPPGGTADLQEIYDRIMKRYPFYKYRQGTTGWQSSVRHNLLQNDRFKENGRSGKGKLWTVDHSVPLEKEKKRKVTPPQRPPVPQGFPMPPQFGQQQYGNPYAHPQQNGQPRFNAGQPSGAYFSPYGQAGQHGPYGAPQHPNPNNQSQPRHQAQQPNGQAPPPPNRNNQWFQPIVEEIMRHREVYLTQFMDSHEAFTSHLAIYENCMVQLSDLFHGAKDVTEILPLFTKDEEKKVFAQIDAIFSKYKHLRPKSGGPNGKACDGEQVHKAVNNALENGGAVTNGVGEPAAPQPEAQFASAANTDANLTNAASTSNDPSVPGPSNSSELPPGTTGPTETTQPEPAPVLLEATRSKRPAEDIDEEPDAKRVREE